MIPVRFGSLIIQSAEYDVRLNGANFPASGVASFDCRGVNAVLEYQTETYPRNGITYMRMRDLRATQFTVSGCVSSFPGSADITIYCNREWQQIFQQIQPQILLTIQEAFTPILERMFASIPRSNFLTR